MAKHIMMPYKLIVLNFTARMRYLILGIRNECFHLHFIRLQYFFHFNKCKKYFDLEQKSASSGTKSLLLQARNRMNFLKHMPTNKTNESVMGTSTAQKSLGKCTVSTGHSLLTHTSDPLLCLSAHKERRCM